jgi:hypothetical protein
MRHASPVFALTQQRARVHGRRKKLTRRVRLPGCWQKPRHNLACPEAAGPALPSEERPPGIDAGELLLITQGHCHPPSGQHCMAVWLLRTRRTLFTRAAGWKVGAVRRSLIPSTRVM